MASYSDAASAHKTLSGTTADSVTITGGVRLVVINRDVSAPLYVRGDGTTAVAEAGGTRYVGPGAWVEIDKPADGGAVSVVGNGNAYSVEAVTQ